MQCFNCIQNVTKRHEKRRSSRRAWHKCHFICIRYGVFRSSRITIHLACGVRYLDDRKRFVSRADEILLSIHRLDDESKMLMSCSCEVVEKESFTFSKVSLLSNCVSISQTASPICGIRKVSANTPTGASANAFCVMLAMSDEAST